MASDDAVHAAAGAIYDAVTRLCTEMYEARIGSVDARTYLAGQALAGCAAHFAENKAEVLATRCVQFADAVLAELAQPKAGG